LLNLEPPQIDTANCLPEPMLNPQRHFPPLAWSISVFALTTYKA